MRYYILTLICATTVIAQPFPPDSVWTFAFDDGGDEYFYDAIEVSDGYLLCGEAREWNALAGVALLVKIDREGELVWARRFPADIPRRFTRFGERLRSVVLSELSPNGVSVRIIWGAMDISYQSIDTLFFESSESNHVVYGGYVHDTGWPISRLNYSERSPSGQTLLKSTVWYGWPSPDTTYVYNPNVTFNVVGCVEQNDPYNPPTYFGSGRISGELGFQGVLHLASETDNGTTLLFGGAGDEKIQAVLEWSPDTLVLFGSSSTGSAGTSDGWILWTDFEGTVSESWLYGGLSADNFVEYKTSWDSLGFNGFIIAGNFSSEDINFEQSDFWLLKVDENGDSVWSRLAGGDEADRCEGMIQTENGFFLFGSSMSFAAPGWDACAMLLSYVPDIAATPASLNFGPVNVGSSSVRTVGLINTGSNVLTVSEIVGTENYSADFPEPQTVAIGETLRVEITFAPQTPGTHVDTLRVISDALSGVKIVRCLGAGTAVDAEDATLLPTEFKLHPPYPNPFNPTTTIGFDLARHTTIELTIFDVQGRVVDVLSSESLSAGSYSRDWSCSTCAGGVYFARLRTSEFVGIQKLVLLK